MIHDFPPHTQTQTHAQLPSISVVADDIYSSENILFPWDKNNFNTQSIVGFIQCQTIFHWGQTTSGKWRVYYLCWLALWYNTSKTLDPVMHCHCTHHLTGTRVYLLRALLPWRITYRVSEAVDSLHAVWHAPRFVKYCSTAQAHVRQGLCK